MTLYDSPCDEPGYYFHEYKEEYLSSVEREDEWKLDQYLSGDQDQFDKILEVNWEAPR